VVDKEPDSIVEHNESDMHQLRSIGAALRSRRQALGLSLRDLSRQTGLSIGFLSLVERGRSSPAITSFSNIARALNIELSQLFPEAERKIEAESKPKNCYAPYVHRTGEGSQVAFLSGQRTYEFLAPRGVGMVLEPLLVTVHPGKTLDEPFAHEGEEFAYVLSGEMVYVVDDVEYRLSPGDSIYVRSTVPHALRNDTDKPVTALWVVTPRLL